ncbi:right-handed parallel beta-helix repeat-containing protein [Paenibacillus sp. TRM 82003]|nr:right-handed parallel beta-helix repeat-containing protein [Paenibacillus sp. TRM 82003]MCI3923429.1 right-handed parallel beta-helix repeat-containing protein [Paenibacillus sp. TRM 82003]
MGTLKREYSRRDVIRLGVTALVGALIGTTGDAERASAETKTIDRVFDIKSYGAKGSGMGYEDDSIPIQRAIDDASATGGIVLIPDGIYYIHRSLTVRSNVKLAARGGKSVIRNYFEHMNALHIVPQSKNVIVEGIHFEGRASAIGLNDKQIREMAIHAKEAEKLIVQSCQFNMYTRGITIEKCKEVIIRGCKIVNTIRSTYKNEGVGLFVTETNGFELERNEFINGSGTSLHVTEHSETGKIKGNKFNTTESSAVIVEAQGTEIKDIEISENVMKCNNESLRNQMEVDSIHVKGKVRDIRVFSNQIHNSIGAAIKFKNIKNEYASINIIRDNLIQDPKEGISVEDTSETSIIGNIINKASINGIVIDASKYSISRSNFIDHNLIISAGAAAIIIKNEKCIDNIVGLNNGRGNKLNFIDNGLNTTRGEIL